MQRKTALIAGGTALALLLAAGGTALAQRGHHGYWGGGAGMGMLERFDRDGSGSFSQEDVDAVRSERFAAFDANGDGVLDLEEYQALWLDAMHRHMVRAFQRLDVDGNAQVTEEEFTAPFAGMVRRLDRDGDGVVTGAELREMREQRRGEMRGRMRDGEGRMMRRGPAPE